MNQKYAFATNNVLIYITTSIIVTILHELAHFLVANYFDLHPVLYHNYVNYSDKFTASQGLYIAAAGPLFSLLQGIICMFWTKKIKQKGLFSLTILWLGLQGILTFMGYLLIAPFFAYGDTGKVFAILGVPMFMRIIISILSIIIITWYYLKQTAEMVQYAYSDDLDRKTIARDLLLLPIFLGGLINASLQLPVPTFLSLIAPIFMPFTFMSVYGNYRNIKHDFLKPSVLIKEYSISVIIFFVICVTVFRILRYGISF